MHTSAGSVEQRPNGWFRIRRGREQLICNKCWRVTSVVFKPNKKPYSEVEFLENNRWHRCEIDTEKLLDKPFRALQKACLELQLSAFTFDATWQSRAMCIACQFHQHEVKTIKPLGIDLSAGVLRTSRTEISLADGSFAAFGNPANESFLPLAGRELPSSKALAAILGHNGLTRTISALVHQLTTHFSALDEVAVIGCGQYAQLAQQVLNACGFRDQNALPILSTHRDNGVFGIDKAKLELLGGQASWATASSDVAHWLAGIRPVTYLGHKCDVSTVVNDHQLQRTVLHLLARALVTTRDALKPCVAVQRAWETLITDVKLDQTRAPGIVSPLTRTQAIGHWLSKAIVTASLSICSRKPRTFSRSTLWFDKRSERFSIHKAGINVALKKHSAPAWDLVELQKAIEVDPHFHGHAIYGRSEVWRLSTKILSPAALEVLTGPDRQSVDEPALISAS